ncbi:MAG: hypothetical protein DRH08_05270 [Deltaproteobacteria bacterium]|nr:MAG: hypothetical protein DRH08_05270 [Deltaproteobacteria bacterium]
MSKNGRQGEGGGVPAIVLSSEQVTQVETLASVLSKGQIADYFGIGRTTFYEIEKRQPEVSEHYQRGKAKAIFSVAGKLLTKARAGDTTSIIFYLKTQAGYSENSEEQAPVVPRRVTYRRATGHSDYADK